MRDKDQIFVLRRQGIDGIFDKAALVFHQDALAQHIPLVQQDAAIFHQ